MISGAFSPSELEPPASNVASFQPLCRRMKLIPSFPKLIQLASSFPKSQKILFCGVPTPGSLYANHEGANRFLHERGLFLAEND
jgi:hypothetical protein